MDELRYNSEGYYDPVVFEALTKIEREEQEARRKAAYRPLVYICSPYAGDIEKNTYRARAFSRFAVERITMNSTNPYNQVLSNFSVVFYRY